MYMCIENLFNIEHNLIFCVSAIISVQYQLSCQIYIHKIVLAVYLLIRYEFHIVDLCSSEVFDTDHSYNGCWFNLLADYTCEEGQYKCPFSPHCIPMEYICDGLPDCFFGEDERNCTGDYLTFNPAILLDYW